MKLLAYALWLFAASGCAAATPTVRESAPVPAPPVIADPEPVATGAGTAGPDGASSAAEPSAVAAESGAAAPVAARPPTLVEPLPAEQRAKLLASPMDPAPDKLDGVTSAQEGKHYVAGNEWNLHLFRESLAELGGGFVGVGSDQTYLLIGWQRPEVAWMMDYDPVIADVHAVYHALFRHHDTPEAFLAAWDADNKRAGVAIVEAALAQARPAERNRLVATYTRYRARIRKRLGELKDTLVAQSVPSFLTDQGTYTWLRAFVEAGRVRALTGNLLGHRAMKGIGAAARSLGVPIRALYVSNAEQYWKYSRTYRTNIGHLPYDDRSVLVRTLLTWKRNRDYRYVIQPMANYQAWLRQPWVRSVMQVIKPRTDASTAVEFFVFDGDPEAAAAARAQRRLQ